MKTFGKFLTEAKERCNITFIDSTHPQQDRKLVKKLCQWVRVQRFLLFSSHSNDKEKIRYPKDKVNIP